MLYIHQLSGRTFTAKPGSGRFGAACVDGTWDSGQAGTIWPGEQLRNGTSVWAAR